MSPAIATTTSLHQMVDLAAEFHLDPAGWIQVFLALAAIILAVYLYFHDYRGNRTREQRRQTQLKRGILAALKHELEIDWHLLHHPRLLAEKESHPEYYDPTRQIFRYRDDAIMVALSKVESDVLLDSDLARQLLEVSQAVRFVNQQVEELMAFRFGSPEALAKATDLFRNHRTTWVDVVAGRKTAEKWSGPWFQELALRHWAIVNRGYWDKLLPSLTCARELVNPALEAAGLEPLHMPEYELAPADAEGVSTAQDVMSTGSSGSTLNQYFTSRSKSGSPQ